MSSTRQPQPGDIIPTDPRRRDFGARFNKVTPEGFAFNRLDVYAAWPQVVADTVSRHGLTDVHVYPVEETESEFILRLSGIPADSTAYDNSPIDIEAHS